MRYDLAVVGSGPGGQKAAIAAAKLGKRVVIIERRRELLGGVSLHTGTIPSKTIREAILHLTGYRHRDVYEDSYRRKARNHDERPAAEDPHRSSHPNGKSFRTNSPATA